MKGGTRHRLSQQVNTTLLMAYSNSFLFQLSYFIDHGFV